MVKGPSETLDAGDPYDWEAWSTPDEFPLADADEVEPVPRAEELIWEWLGARIPQLQPQVERLCHGDLYARLEAFEKLDRYRARMSDGAYADALRAISHQLGLARTDDRFHAASTNAPSTLRLTSREGEVELRHVGNDVAAVRELLERAAEDAGTSLEAVAGPLPPGRPTAATLARRGSLVALIGHARKSGAGLEAIGQVLQLRKQRVHDLARLADRAA